MSSAELTECLANSEIYDSSEILLNTIAVNNSQCYNSNPMIITFIDFLSRRAISIDICL